MTKKQEYEYRRAAIETALISLDSQLTEDEKWESEAYTNLENQLASYTKKNRKMYKAFSKNSLNLY